MFRRKGLVLWILLGLSVALVPIACGGGDDPNPEPADAAGETTTDAMTGS